MLKRVQHDMPTIQNDMPTVQNDMPTVQHDVLLTKKSWEFFPSFENNIKKRTFYSNSKKNVEVKCIGGSLSSVVLFVLDFFILL